MTNGSTGEVKGEGVRSYFGFLRNGYVKLGLGLVAGFLGLWTGISLIGGGRETLYDKVMDDGRKVKYIEDSNGENGMGVNYGKDSLKYVDLEGAISIDWMSEREPSYVNNKLERIEARIDGKDYVFTIDNINENTLEGKRAKAMFEKSNKDYNDRRKKIRDELIKGYWENTKSLDKLFGDSSTN